MDLFRWMRLCLRREIAMFGVGPAFRNAARVLVSRAVNKQCFTVEIPQFGRLTARRGDSDYDTIIEIFGYQEYKVPQSAQNRIFEQYQRILNAGRMPVIIDAGANIGSSAIWFRTKYPKARVIAVEPESGNVEMLRQNVDGYSTISVVEAAIGSKSGFVSLVGSEKSWAVRTELSNSGCPIVTINQLLDMVPNGKPFLIKIDIEGFEKELFSGNLGWIDQMFAIFIEPHDWMLPGEQTSRNFQRALGTGEFEIFVRGENLIYVRAPIPGD
jgi:FkbM family methyltransferase